jgi:hypothetical protein
MEQSEADQLRNSSVVILETEAKPSFLPFCRVRLNIKKRKPQKPKNTSKISIRSSQISEAMMSELNSNDSFSYQYVNYESSSPSERVLQPDPVSKQARNLGFKVKRPNIQNVNLPQIIKNEEERSQYNSELFRCAEKDYATQPFNSHRSGRLTTDFGSKKVSLVNYSSSQRRPETTAFIDDEQLEFDERRENERASVMNEELVVRNCKLIDEIYLLRELISLFGVKFDLPAGYLNIRERIPEIREKLEHFVNIEEKFKALQHESAKTLERLKQQEEFLGQFGFEGDDQKVLRSNFDFRKFESAINKSDASFQKSNKINDELQTLTTKLSECQDDLFKSQNALESLKKKSEMNQILDRQKIMALEDSFREQIESLRQSSSKINNELGTFHEFFIIMSRIRLLEKTKTLKIKKMEVIQTANEELRKLLRSTSMRNIEAADVVPLELRHSDLYETVKRGGNLDESDLAQESHETETKKFPSMHRLLERLAVGSDFSIKESQEKLIHLNAQIQLLRETFTSQLEKHRAKIQNLEQEKSKLQFQNKNLLMELHILDEKAHVLISEKELLEEQLRAKDDSDEKYKELQLNYKMLENKLELMNSFKELGGNAYGNEEDKLKLSEFSSGGERRLTKNIGLNGTIDEIEESQEDAESQLFQSKQYRSGGYSVLATSVIHKRALIRTLAVTVNYSYVFEPLNAQETDRSSKQCSQVLRSSKQEEIDSPSMRNPSKLQKSRFMISESPMQPEVTKSSNPGKKKLFDKNEILRSISELPKSLKSSQKQLERSEQKARTTKDFDRLTKTIQKAKGRIELLSESRIDRLLAKVTQFEVRATQRLAAISEQIHRLKMIPHGNNDYNEYYGNELHRQMDSLGHLKLVPQICDLKQPSGHHKNKSGLHPLKRNTLDQINSPAKMKLVSKSIAVPTVNSLFESRGKSKSQKSLRAKRQTVDSATKEEIDDKNFKELMNNFVQYKKETLANGTYDHHVPDIMPQFANLNIFKGKSVQDFESEGSQNDKEVPQTLKVEPRNIFTAGEASPHFSTHKENDQLSKEKLDHNVYLNSICSDAEEPTQPLGYDSFKPRISSGALLHSMKQESNQEFVEKITLLENRVKEYEYTMSQLKTEIRDLEETLLQTNTRNKKLTSIVDNSYKIAIETLSQDSPNAGMFQPDDLPAMTETLCRNEVNLREILQTQNEEIDQLKKELYYFATTLQNQSIDKENGTSPSVVLMRSISQNESRFNRPSFNESYAQSARHEEVLNEIESARSSMRPTNMHHDRETFERLFGSKVADKSVQIITSCLQAPNKRESFDEFKMRQDKIKKSFGEIVDIVYTKLNQNTYYYNSILGCVASAQDGYDHDENIGGTDRTYDPGVSAIVGEAIANNESIMNIIEFIERTIEALLKEFIEFKREQSSRIHQKIREEKGYESLGFEVQGVQKNLHSDHYASNNLELIELNELSSPHRLTETESNTRVTALLGYSHSRETDHYRDDTQRARTTNVLDRVRQGGHIMPNQEISELVLPRKDDMNDFEKSYELLLNIVFHFKRIIDAEDLNIEQKLTELYEMSEEINQL